MRVFVAVVPPPSVVEDLDAFLAPRQVARVSEGWRWTRPHQLHLTLAFLPDLPTHLEESLVEAGRVWAARAGALDLRLEGAGAFPGPARAQVLWMGVGGEAARERLTDWARAIRGWAGHLGARTDGRSFRPHLTVARTRSHRGAPGGRLVQALDEYCSPTWQASALALIESRLGVGPGGSPSYERLAQWDLGGGLLPDR